MMRHVQHATRLRITTRLLPLLALGSAMSLLLAPAAVAETSGDFTCASGFPPPAVSGNLIVPPGGSCTMSPEDTVEEDVIVNKGATFTNEGGRIGHDVLAQEPAGIGLGGGISGSGSFVAGSIGGNVAIEAVSSLGPGTGGDNYVCSSQIGHNLVISNSAAGAGAWIIGDTDPALCAFGDTVGGNLVVEGNANAVDVSDNNIPAQYAIGRNLIVQGNTLAPVVESNTVGHNAICQDTTNDGDGSPNVSGHQNKCG